MEREIAPKKKREPSKKPKNKDGIPVIDVPEMTIRTRRRGKGPEEEENTNEKRGLSKDVVKKGGDDVFNF